MGGHYESKHYFPPRIFLRRFPDTTKVKFHSDALNQKTSVFGSEKLLDREAPLLNIALITPSRFHYLIPLPLSEFQIMKAICIDKFVDVSCSDPFSLNGSFSHVVVLTMFRITMRFKSRMFLYLNRMRERCLWRSLRRGWIMWICYMWVDQN